MKDDIRARSLLIGLMAGFSFSSASIIIRLLTISVESIVTYRLIIGGTLLILLLKPKITEIKRYIRTVFLMGTLLFLHFFFFVKSVKDTYILNSTLLVNTTPIITLIILGSFRLEKIHRREIIAVILGFLGIMIISLVSPIKGFGKIGDLEALIASLVISLYGILGRLRLSKFTKIEEMAGLIYIIAGFESLIINVPRGVLEVTLNNQNIILILLLGLIPTAFGHTAFLKSLEGLKPHESQLLSMLEPLGATLMALILFSEIPPQNSIIGAILVALAIYIIAKRGESQNVE